MDEMAHHGLCLEVLDSLVALVIGVLAGPLVATSTIGTAQRLASPIGAGAGAGGGARRSGRLGVGCAIVAAGADGLKFAAAISNDVFLEIAAIVLGLTLAAGGGEEAFLGLSATADARRVVGVVDAAEIASHFAAAAGNAGLVNALVLGVGAASVGLAVVLRSVIGRRRGALLGARAAGLVARSRVDGWACGGGTVGVLGHGVVLSRERAGGRRARSKQPTRPTVAGGGEGTKKEKAIKMHLEAATNRLRAEGIELQK